LAESRLAALSAELASMVLLAAGKKRGFCPRASSDTALSAELASMVLSAAGKKRGFCPRASSDTTLD